MLSVFPTLLIFSIFAPLLIRVAAGLVFFWLGWRILGTDRKGAQEALGSRFGSLGTFAVFIGGGIEIIIGLLLIAGFLTQIAALIGVITALKLAFFKNSLPTIAPHGRTTYLLLAVMCASLLLSGAGAFAIDLPL